MKRKKTPSILPSSYMSGIESFTALGGKYLAPMSETQGNPPESFFWSSNNLLENFPFLHETTLNLTVEIPKITIPTIPLPEIPSIYENIHFRASLFQIDTTVKPWDYLMQTPTPTIPDWRLDDYVTPIIRPTQDDKKKPRDIIPTPNTTKPQTDIKQRAETIPGAEDRDPKMLNGVVGMFQKIFQEVISIKPNQMTLEVTCRIHDNAKYDEIKEKVTHGMIGYKRHNAENQGLVIVLNEDLHNFSKTLPST